jgi:TRAP-type C4-dicarboxylate transport system permease small subunit
MKKVLSLLDKYFEETILSCMMAYFVFATSAQVVARYVLKVSVPWAEETARYVFIWMTFLGASYAAKKGIHIRVDLLESAMKKHGAVIKHISSIIFLVFLLVIVVAGVSVCSGMVKMPQYSTVLHIPMIVVYAAVPVGMLLTAFRTIQSIYREIQNKGGEPS